MVTPKEVTVQLPLVSMLLFTMQGKSKTILAIFIISTLDIPANTNCFLIYCQLIVYLVYTMQIKFYFSEMFAFDMLHDKKGLIDHTSVTTSKKYLVQI